MFNGGIAMIGLKRGTVELLPHQPLWEDEAAKTIMLLKALLKAVIFLKRKRNYWKIFKRYNAFWMPDT